MRPPSLRGLGAIALVLILLSNATGGALLPGGFVGFDLFFVISGFLVTERFLRIALREVSIPSKVILGEVLAHRARTIFPLTTVVLLVLTVAVLLAYPSTEWEGFGVEIVAAAFFITNWLFAGHLPAFTAEVADSPFRHYWAIAVEFQFFLLWTAILMVMLFLARPQSTRSSGRSRWRVRPAALRRNTAWAAIILTGLSLAWAVLLATTDQDSTFFHTSTRMWELGIGAILAVFATRFTRIPQVGGHVASVIGLLGILGAAVFFDSSMAYPGYLALVPTLGAAAMIIGALANPGLGMGRVLDSAPVCWLGERSLSIYLWHWPVLAIGGHLLGAAPTVGQAMMLVAASVLPAWVSHRFLAQRIVRWRAANRTTNALSMGVLLLCTCVLAGLLLLTIARF